MNAEFKHKVELVRGVIKTAGAEAALLARQPNFSWLTCGGEGHVALISERAVAPLVVTPKKVYLIANGIEMPRLLDEEVKGLGLEPLRFDWENPPGAKTAFAKVADPAKTISDTGEWDTRLAPELFNPLRYSLHTEEVKRLRAVSRAAVDAMESACRAVKLGMTENAIAGLLSESCLQVNVTPVVVLIAVDERIRKYRHPLPSQKKLKRCAMLVLCARQHGLIVSVSRLVHFGKLSAALKRRHEAVCKVDATFIHNTRVGTTVRDIFNRGVEAYAANGYAQEWRLHHQGGPCGYQTREYVGTPTVVGEVLENQAFAWNPSITGTKSEDTILATAKGPQILTASKSWPMLTVECEDGIYLRPDILVR